MATWRNLTIGALRLTDPTNIAAALRCNARNADRTLALLGLKRSRNGNPPTAPKPWARWVQIRPQLT